MRKLFKHIGMICLALAVAVGSFFVPIRKPNRSQMASADNSVQDYSFSGSNLFNLVNGYNFDLSNEVAKSGLYIFDFSIDFSRTGNFLYFDVSDSSFAKFDNSSLNYGFVDAFTNSTNTSKTFSYNFNTSSFSGFDGNLYTSASRFHLDINISSSDFNANIYKINIFSVVSNLGTPSNRRYVYNNWVRYYDVNDNYIEFGLGSYLLNKTYTATDEFFLYDNRVYYLETDFTDEELYNQGYNAGMNDNQGEIYNNGYNAGFDDGFSDGKTEGIVESNNYSFISLFGGLFDAPVTMLMGLLNFEFLGINLWAFVTSLFTLALVLFIVKLIMGR